MRALHRRLSWWLAGMLLAVALALPVSVAAGPAKPAGRPGGPPRRPPPRGGSWHVVRPGESLGSIARHHGVSLEALRRANRLRGAERLRAGRRLLIPSPPGGPEGREPPSQAEAVAGGPPPPQPDVVLAWPVAVPVASPFGPRGSEWHGGIDLLAEPGTPIRAAAAGMVITSGWEAGYGHVVKIWHHGDLMTVYAHNQENQVRIGDWVERGQVVATVGQTGRATAAHLHFEVRLGGRAYDPMFWLPAEPLVDLARSLGPRGELTP